MEELILIQKDLRVTKDNTKQGIQFKYRTAEDILEKAKPLCIKNGVLLTLTDSVEVKGEFVYVRSTATVIKGDKKISCDGWAKEPSKLMSMSAPQITGSCSSYARKTALGGLFALDNNQDPDSGIHGDGKTKEATVEQFQRINDLKMHVNPQQKAWADRAVNSGLNYEEAERVIKNLEGTVNGNRNNK